MSKTFPQPETHPDDFVPLEIIGGSLDGSMLPIPLPLPAEFLQVVRKPRTVEVYRREERYPAAGDDRLPRVVYVFQTYAKTDRDLDLD
jgi:hypothetical protein